MSDRFDMPAEVWVVEESGFDPERANVRETLCTVGNGYLGTRGTLEEGHPATSRHLSRGRVRRPRLPRDRPGEGPDWLSFAVYVDGARLDVRNAAVLDHERTLDLRTGLPTGARSSRTPTAAAPGWRRCAARGSPTAVRAPRGDHAREPRRRDHGRERARRPRRNLERLPVYPEGTTFPLETRWEKWALTRHLDRTDRVAVGDVAYLEMRTIASGITLGYAATTCSARPQLARAHGGGRRIIVAGRLPGRAGAAGQARRIGTSRDRRPAARSGKAVATGSPRRRSAGGFDAIVAASAAAWEQRWDDCDCTIDGDPASTPAMRFGVYHLLIAANDEDPTVNIGAKSLSGEGYRGHVFWDTEILMLPFFVYTRPEAARSLLAYRHHTLPGARENARINGIGGSALPVGVGRHRREECPSSPRTGPTGSGRARRRCTSTPTSPTG